MSAGGKRHMGRIARMQCICCRLLGKEQTSKTDVHHIREGQGGAQRADDMLTLPLCHDDCHQGRNGVHGERIYLRILKMTELDLLAIVLEEIYA